LEFSEQVAVGCQDADVQVFDQDQDALACLSASDADVVQAAVVSQGARSDPDQPRDHQPAAGLLQAALDAVRQRRLLLDRLDPHRPIERRSICPNGRATTDAGPYPASSAGPAGTDAHALLPSARAW
jgi:hypothetical protein